MSALTLAETSHGKIQAGGKIALGEGRSLFVHRSLLQAWKEEGPAEWSAFYQIAKRSPLSNDKISSNGQERRKMLGYHQPVAQFASISAFGLRSCFRDEIHQMIFNLHVIRPGVCRFLFCSCGQYPGALDTHE